MNQFYKNLSLWLVISLMMILLFNIFNKPKPTQERLNYSDFITAVDGGKVKSVIISGNDLLGKYTDGKEFRTYRPIDASITETLIEKKIEVSAKPE